MTLWRGEGGYRRREDKWRGIDGEGEGKRGGGDRNGGKGCRDKWMKKCAVTKERSQIQRRTSSTHLQRSQNELCVLPV